MSEIAERPRRGKHQLVIQPLNHEAAYRRLLADETPHIQAEGRKLKKHGEQDTHNGHDQDRRRNREVLSRPVRRHKIKPILRRGIEPSHKAFGKRRLVKLVCVDHRSAAAPRHDAFRKAHSLLAVRGGVESRSEVEHPIRINEHRHLNLNIAGMVERHIRKPNSTQESSHKT